MKCGNTFDVFLWIHVCFLNETEHIHLTEELQWDVFEHNCLKYIVCSANLCYTYSLAQYQIHFYCELPANGESFKKIVYGLQDYDCKFISWSSHLVGNSHLWIYLDFSEKQGFTVL